MSYQDPQQQPYQSTPPGWYPDPYGGGGQRWWDGAAWTANATQPGAPMGGPGGGQTPFPSVPPGTSALTPWIWLVVGLPLLSDIGLLFLNFGSLFDSVGKLPSSMGSGGTYNVPDTGGFYAATGGMVVGSLLISLAGLVVTALTIFFAYRDWKELARRGVASPFHWAWQFLSPVYVIGRTVVARRRGATQAMWPIWALVAVYVISLVIAVVMIVEIFSSMNAMFANLSTYSGYSS